MTFEDVKAQLVIDTLLYGCNLAYEVTERDKDGRPIAVRLLDPTEAPATSRQGASVGTRYCEDCDGFGVFDLTLNSRGVWCASCNGTGRG